MMQNPIAAAARPSESDAGDDRRRGCVATSSRNRYEAIVQTSTRADLAHSTR